MIVPLADRSALKFDCGEVSPRQVRAALLGEPAAATAPPSGGEGLEYLYTYYQCELTHYFNYVPAMGEYVYVFTDANCLFTEIYGPAEGGGGGGGGPMGGIAPPQAYCPNTDPNCLKPLSRSDSLRIESALTLVNQNIPVCKQAYDRVMQMYNKNRVYRGNLAVHDDPNDPHDAQSRGGSDGFIHVDKDYLVLASSSGIAKLLLHEGWHLATNLDHNEPGPNYTTYPFNQQNACVSSSN